MNRIYTLILFVSLTSALNAYNLRQLSNKEGLSNSAILSICQDSERFVWIGTADGLNMYNGSEIEVFKPELNPLGSLSGNLIEEVWEGEKGIIWINTNHGLNRYNKRTKVIDSYDEFEGKYFWTKTSGNEIFVINANNTINYYDRRRNKFTPIEYAGIVKDDIRRIFIDRSDLLWIVTGKNTVHTVRISFETEEAPPALARADDFVHDCGIRYAFPEKNTVYFIDEKYYLFEMDAVSRKKSLVLNLKKEVEERGAVSSIVRDNDDYLVAFQTNGVIRIKNTPENTVKYEVENIGINCGVFCLHKDCEQDILWIGTDGQGLYMYTGDLFSIRSFTFENLQFSIQKPTRALFPDKNGNLWIGTKDDGILRINGYAVDGDMPPKKIDHITTQNSALNSNSIYAFAGSRRNIIWIGSDGPGLNYYSCRDKCIRKLPSDDPEEILYIHSIHETDDSTLWLASVGSGIYKVIIAGTEDAPVVKSVKRYTFEKDEMSYNFFFTACRENDSILWFGNRGYGLRRLNIRNDTFRRVQFPPSQIHTVNDILSINRDSRGNIWVGTSFGILKIVNYNPETNEVSCTNYSDMPNNTVHGILEDDRGRLWISTNDGLVQFDTQQEKFRKYNHRSGLSVFEFSDGASMKDEKTGTLFFGGINGFVTISPDEYSSKKEFVPPIFFTGLKIYEEKQNLNDFMRTGKNTEFLQLKYDQNFFSISFVAPDYINGQNCRYFYNLENFSSKWIENGNSTSASFTNISPGRYVLHVRCDNSDAVTGTYSLPVVILPPRYMTAGAYAAYLLLSILTLFSIIQLTRRRYRLKREMIIEKMRQHQKEEIYESKLRFFTNITHEFSTPLTLIYGPCNRIISYEKADGFIKKYAGMILKNTERLYLLIQELIEFRRIETGHKACLIEPLAVTELSGNIADSFAELAESKKILFQCDVPQDLCWNSDRGCLTKILTNLLSNAFKYTPDEGSIDLRIHRQDGTLDIAIRNTGRGIREKDIPTIFDRYHVLDSLEKQTQNGFFSRNGLGLAICYSMVKILGGEIRVESILNEYTEFRVSLPHREATADGQGGGELRMPPAAALQQKEADETPERISPSAKPTVFVIDDDPEMRWFIAEIMKDHYHVIAIENPLTVNGILETVHPRLIISDIMMPELDGITLMKQIKGNRRTAHIPFILLSAKNTPEEQTEGIAAGAEAYVVKPFNVEYLQSVADRLLKRQTDLRDYYRSPISAFEFSDGRFIHSENKAFFEKILNMIDRNMANPDFTTEDLARELGLSARHLYRRMKDFSKQTPATLIREYKLSVVEKLLVTSKYSVDEIMYMSGFNNRGSFYRLFSQKYGMTPKKYRDAKISADIGPENPVHHPVKD
ncbi:MAG: helix-turn-helix domain-containing protein [Tannerella sp.]|jgi:signal transduction histidine kinase/ligand-binding sensor domain-containing protein/CheY-like chemotaxis protein|nr:helix-turn-helix domain-containing protein [Tannerella sp.]